MEKSCLNITENLKKIHHDIGEALEKYRRSPQDVQLMAVTKTVPAALVNHAIGCGVSLLGENRAQELLSKYDDYHKEAADLHFIGHLQSNKVRQIIDKVSMIQSVDSIKLAKEIHTQAVKTNRVMDVLVEVNVGDEATKHGVAPQQVATLCEELTALSGIRVRGLMTIPPNQVDSLQTERYFYQMHQLSVDITAKKLDNICMDILSYGMSGDYALAIKHGSNIVRIGTAIFGSR